MTPRPVHRLTLVLLGIVSLAVLSGPALGDDEEPKTPREAYNVALEKMAAGALDEAEAGFLDARTRARQDAELRYRTAFNLGMTYAARADQAAPPPVQDAEKAKAALEHLQKAADWFRDAARQRPGDEDARVNLEIVRRRITQLADLANKGDASLEKRLDQLIEEQRALRDQVRELMSRVAAAGAKTEPVAFREEYRAIAGTQRTVLSDANALAEAAGAEIDHLNGLSDEERTQEQAVRAVQLGNLMVYLDRSRELMADTRRLLRKLQGDQAHRKSDATVQTLKRAREQLLDPITVLKAVAGDELQLMQQAAALAALRHGPIRLDDGQELQAPVWLTTPYLGERQGDATQRAEELLARLQAGVAAAAQADPNEQSAPQDPRQRQLIEEAGEAVPIVVEAVNAMQAATTALAEDHLDEAVPQLQLALEALSRAIERFAGVRDLIELAYAEQQGVVDLLSPPAPDTDAQNQAPPPPPEERQRLLVEGVARNRERVQRLEGLFATEVQALHEKRAAAAAQAAGGQGAPAPDESTDQELQRYELAEAQRQRAALALSALSDAIEALDRQASPLVAQPPPFGTPEAPGAPALGEAADATPLDAEPTPPAETEAAARARGAAEDAEKEIEALRLLFLSTIEHLKELARRQSETLDRTSSAQTGLPADEAAQIELVGPIGAEQTQHESVATAIAEALRAQADQAGAGAQAGSGDPAQAAQALGSAAAEVDAAASAMRSAAGAMTQTPLDLGLATEQEKTALQHLMTAIQILEPPQQQQQPQDGEQKQQEEKMSRDEAERKLQAVREREAERRRQKNTQSQAREPVDKDW